MTQTENKNILLILDLDETLVHTTPNKLNREPEFKVFDYYVYLRPHLDYFLDTIKDDFSIAIWSSASDDYVKKVVERIVPEHIHLEFVWGRSRCIYKRQLDIDQYGNLQSRYSDNHYYVKPLKKVKRKGYTIDKILIVDDTPHKSSDNYGNAIYPKEFLGDLKDNELKLLSDYLKQLKDVDNVRTIEKRGWRDKVKN